MVIQILKVMKNRHYILFLKLLIILHVLISTNSCENYVTGFEIGEQPKKLVLNAIISPDSIFVHLSNSIGVNDLLNINNWILIEDATVVLFENNEKIGNLEYVELVLFESYYFKTGYYTLRDFSPKIGVTYRIEVDYPGFPKISAETVIPSVPQSINIDTLRRFQKDEYGNDWIFDIIPEIINNNGKKNYYGFFVNLIYDDYIENIKHNVYYYTTSGSWVDFIRDEGWYTTPQVGDNNIESNYFFASDKGLSSEPFSMKFYLGSHLFQDMTIKAIEFNIVFFDSDLYAHLFSIARRYSSRDQDFFEEKVSIYSNVNNGLGIFGAKNSYSYIIIK